MLIVVEQKVSRLEGSARRGPATKVRTAPMSFRTVGAAKRRELVAGAYEIELTRASELLGRLKLAAHEVRSDFGQEITGLSDTDLIAALCP